MNVQFDTVSMFQKNSLLPGEIPAWTTMADDLASLNTLLSYMKVSTYPITPIYSTTVANLVEKIQADYQLALKTMNPQTLSADFEPIQNQVLDAGVSPSGASFETACAEAVAGNSKDLRAFLSELQTEPSVILSTLLLVLNNGSQAFRNYKG